MGSFFSRYFLSVDKNSSIGFAGILIKCTVLRGTNSIGDTGDCVIVGSFEILKKTFDEIQSEISDIQIFQVQP